MVIRPEGRLYLQEFTKFMEKAFPEPHEPTFYEEVFTIVDEDKSKYIVSFAIFAHDKLISLTFSGLMSSSYSLRSSSRILDFHLLIMFGLHHGKSKSFQKKLALNNLFKGQTKNK